MQKYIMRPNANIAIPTLFASLDKKISSNLLATFNSWVSSDLENNTLCDFIIENQNECLNPNLLQILWNRFFGFKQSPELNHRYTLFWREIYARQLERYPHECIPYFYVMPKIAEYNEDAILHCLETVPSFQKNKISHNNFLSEDVDCQLTPEVYATVRQPDIEKLFDGDEEFAKLFSAKYLFPISNQLAKFHQMNKRFGRPYASGLNRIKEFSNFRHHDPHVLLLHLCILGFKQIISEDQDASKTILDYWFAEWRRNKITDFGKLIIYAIHLSPDDYLNDYLAKLLSCSADDETNILWNYDYRPELYLLFKKRYSLISDENKIIIDNFILDKHNTAQTLEERDSLLTFLSILINCGRVFSDKLKAEVKRFNYKKESPFYYHSPKPAQSPEVLKIKAIARRKCPYKENIDASDYDLSVFSEKYPESAFDLAISLGCNLSSLPNKYKINASKELCTLFLEFQKA